MPGGEITPSRRSAGLHQHGLALGRRNLVQRPADLEIFSPVIDLPHLGGVDIDVVRRIAHERVTVPGRPQRLGDIDELVSHFIAVGMRGKLVVIVVLRRRRLAGGDNIRSEEHTSELQSLMRISYAVFCLKKTNKNASTINTI